MDSKTDTDNDFPELKAIGEGLKRLRKEKGYSNYHKLAYDMGMTHSQYGGYEMGKNMNLSSLLKILRFHNIDLKMFINEYVTLD